MHIAVSSPDGAFEFDGLSDASPDLSEALPQGPHSAASRARQEVAFLSIFKWEERKGWRFLIEAFLREFQGQRS
jgi:hypothetical protein